MRDYEILNVIGYTVQWDKYERRHIVQGYLYQIRERRFDFKSSFSILILCDTVVAEV